MTARFVAQPSTMFTLPGAADVVDRKSGNAVANCADMRWAEMIADGLNVIVDQLTTWSPSVTYSPVVDGEVVDGGVTGRREIES